MIYQLTALTTQLKVKTMTLSYRGLKYEFPAVRVNTNNQGTIAKYRGITYQKQRYTTLEKQICELRYRGLAYKSMCFR